MRYKNLAVLGIGLSICLGVFVRDALAQDRQTIVNNKNVDLLQEIDKGERLGTLTHEEAAAFKAREAKISEKEQDLRNKNSGKLTENDNKSLQEDQARLYKDIRKVKLLEADNTGKNVGDGRLDAPTAQTQSLKKDNVDKSKAIREKLVNDKNLSQNARNVKIITIDGAIILRGPVETTEESLRIGAIAKEVAGDDQVANELQIIK